WVPSVSIGAGPAGALLLLVASPGVTTVTQPPSRDDLARVRKLAQFPEEARHSRFAVSITRLTVLKSLCREPEVAARFVTYPADRVRPAHRPGRQGECPRVGLPERPLLCRALRLRPRHGAAPASAPLVQDIVDFWASVLGLDVEVTSPAGQGTEQRTKRAPRS